MPNTEGPFNPAYSTVKAIYLQSSYNSESLNILVQNTECQFERLELVENVNDVFPNGVLIVRTIKDEYLLAMKMVSARKYKNDYSDIAGIIYFLKHNNSSLTFERIEKAIMDLYGNPKLVSQEMITFVKREFDSNNNDYEEIKEIEKGNRLILIKNIENKDEKNKRSALDDLKTIK